MKTKFIYIGLTIISFICLITSNGFAATTAVATVTVTVLEGESSISLDTSIFNFGAVSGSLSDRRFHAGPANVSYFAGSSPWTIRVYTNNPSHVAGLIGQTDPSKSIALKVWCENYGPPLNPAGQSPNEENIYFWFGYDFNGDLDKSDIITDGSISEIALGFDVNGDGDALDIGLGTPSQPVSEEPIWLRIPDYNEMLPGSPYTWRRLAYSGAELSSSGFPVYLAIDVTGAPTQSYSTSYLTFQIIHE